MRAGWVKKHLGDICESRLGKTLNASTDHGEVKPYLCAVNVKWDTFDLTTIKTAPFDTDEIKKYSVQKGDLLVCEGGETGRAAIWDKEDPIQYQNALHRLRFKPDTILPRFCLHYLHYLKLSGTLDKEYSHGATILHLVTKSLYSIPIEYPSLPDQQRIVEILDNEFLKIDALKANVERSIQAAKDLFQATLNKELEPKDGWKTESLGDVCMVQGGSTPLRTEKAFWENGTYPWFTIEDVREQGRIITDTKQKITKLAWDKMRVFPANSVLLCCTASVGEYAISTIPITSNQQFNGLTIKDEKILLPMFLFHFASTLKDKLLSLSGKTTIDFVSGGKVRSVPISFPTSTDEQQAIISKLDDLNEKCKVLQDNYQKTLTLCDDLKQALLRKAFNGEL